VKSFQKTAVAIVTLVLSVIVGTMIIYAPPELMDGLRTGAGWLVFLVIVVVMVFIGITDTHN
jgi:hypothetical protein